MCTTDKICGVYKITCIINMKSYIGSSKNIHGRWNIHIYQLNKDIHCNSILQNSWNKYGEINFIFEIIEECDIDSLLKREKFWIDYYDCLESGFNIAKIVNDNNRYSQENRTEWVNLADNIVTCIKKDYLSGDINNYICRKYGLNYIQANNIRTLITYSEVYPLHNDLLEKCVSERNLINRMDILLDGRIIDITKTEYETINNILHNKKLGFKKYDALFIYTALVLCKARNIMSECEDNSVYLDIKSIINACICGGNRYKIKSNIENNKYNEYIKFYDIGCRTLFIDSRSESVFNLNSLLTLEISFNELFYNFKYIRCSNCNKLVKKNSNNQKFCLECSKKSEKINSHNRQIKHRTTYT